LPLGRCHREQTGDSLLEHCLLAIKGKQLLGAAFTA